MQNGTAPPSSTAPAPVGPADLGCKRGLAAADKPQTKRQRKLTAAQGEPVQRPAALLANDKSATMKAPAAAAVIMAPPITPADTTAAQDGAGAVRRPSRSARRKAAKRRYKRNGLLPKQNGGVSHAPSTRTQQHAQHNSQQQVAMPSATDADNQSSGQQVDWQHWYSWQQWQEWQQQQQQQQALDGVAQHGVRHDIAGVGQPLPLEAAAAACPLNPNTATGRSAAKQVGLIQCFI